MDKSKRKNPPMTVKTDAQAITPTANAKSTSIAKGDLLTLNITPSGGSLVALTYTMASGDTLQPAAINLANAVNGNAAVAFGGVSATAPVAGVFNLSYGLTPTVSASVTGGGATTTLTVGSASGGADATNLASLNTLLGELL
jgi:hypothetical protein